MIFGLSGCQHDDHPDTLVVALTAGDLNYLLMDFGETVSSELTFPEQAGGRKLQVVLVAGKDDEQAELLAKAVGNRPAAHPEMIEETEGDRHV